MAIIPLALASLNLSDLHSFLALLSAWLLVDLRQRYRQHWLLALHAHLDTGPLEAACAAYHHQSGAGCKPTHSVPRLVRMPTKSANSGSTTLSAGSACKPPSLPPCRCTP